MKQRTLKIHYTVHSWVGIVSAMVIFVVSFSGALALFDDEMARWEMQSLRGLDQQPPAVDIERLLNLPLFADHSNKDVFYTLPDQHNPSVRVFTPQTRQQNALDIALDPVTLQPLASVVPVSDFFTRLHTDLHLPRPWGRYLVGLSGIVLLFSVVTGLIMHRKILKEMFRIRWQRGWRLRLADWHKYLGSWGLLFNIMIAYTGAVIGLVGLVGPLMVISSYGGDLEQAVEAFAGPSLTLQQETAPMPSVQALIDDLETQYPQSHVSSFFVRGYGDANATISVNLAENKTSWLGQGFTLLYKLTDMELLHRSSFRGNGAFTRLYGSFTPLHYALYGGIWIKLMYFVLGLGLALSAATGSMIWLERRVGQRLEKGLPADNHRWLARLLSGSCNGLVVASAFYLFCCSVMGWFAQGWFWCSWLLLLLLAYTPVDLFRYQRWSLLLTGWLLAITGANDLLAQQSMLPDVIFIDSILLLLALILLAVAVRLPLQRPQKRRAKSVPAEAGGAIAGSKP